MKNIAIIPARGGSKRIPRKNIKIFLGKPIIAYSIETALKSGLFDQVIVSTDDEEIAEISMQYGADVPFLRSKENANDFATLIDVLKEVLEKIENKQDINNLCCFLPTAPLVTKNRLVEGYNILNEDNNTSVTPVVQYSYPIWRSFKIKKNNRLEMLWPKYLKSRSQDLPEVYHDSGSFYWISLNAFKQEMNLFTANNSPLVLSEKEVQDIDTQEDWELAELKYKLIHG
jgi:N-acylneuraminate cytidylyltransferase